MVDDSRPDESDEHLEDLMVIFSYPQAFMQLLHTGRVGQRLA